MYIPKQPEKSVSDVVGQPLNLRPACIAQLSQVELLRRRQGLAQIKGASLSNSRLFKSFVYKKSILCTAILLGFSSCSPLRSSPNDEKHQLELTLHEVQTNLDDLRHDINCFQTELQILDGRIKYYENTLATLKQHDLEKQQNRMDQLSLQLQTLEKKWLSFDKTQQGEGKELKELSSHANETTAALSQFKDRIGELEQEIFSQNRRFDDLAKLKGTIENIAKGFHGNFKVYKVKSGDSLEKIARFHKTAVEKIKKLNDLDQDLIVVGQELKIPVE